MNSRRNCATYEPMKVGDITGVLRTQRGYQILKLETRTDSKVKTFEEARGDIANRIGEQKLRGEREKYLDRLREQATITWRNTELKRTRRRWPVGMRRPGRNPGLNDELKTEFACG